MFWSFLLAEEHALVGRARTGDDKGTLPPYHPPGCPLANRYPHLPPPPIPSIPSASLASAHILINRPNFYKNLEVSITTFSYPTSNLSYPAITVCRETPYNPDEYVRSVFDNFQLACNDSCMEYCDASCEETDLMRQDFWEYIYLNLNDVRSL